MVDLKKILFPVDLTEKASKVLPYVMSMAEKYDRMKYLLHVVQDLQRWGKSYVPHSSWTNYRRG